MKEFVSQTGGRYTYLDDFMNLQELALAITAIFEDCDNFIVSGCQVQGSSITPGVVYLNGKLRTFSGANNIIQWPQYIYEVNTTENTPFQSGGEKVGRNIWGCAIASQIPSAVTELTGKAPQSIVINETGGVTMKDAWFGKYAVLLESLQTEQKISGALSSDSMTSANLKATNKVELSNTNGSIKCSTNDEYVTIELQGATGVKYQWRLSNDLYGFELYKNSTRLARFTDEEIEFEKPAIAPMFSTYSITATSNQIYNYSTAGDEGEIAINKLGHNGSTLYYRNTTIYDGKKNKVLSINGKTATVFLDGKLNLNSSSTEGLSLISDKSFTNTAYQKTIVWKDLNQVSLANVGFNNTKDFVFNITSTVGRIQIIGSDGVDLGPNIYEDGKKLSEKYVLKNYFEEELAGKTGSGYSYSKKESDDQYAKLSEGLVQFITPTKRRADLRSDIGAADEANTPKLSKLLSDMATDNVKKAQIRANIGAAAASDIQLTLSDTGWVHIQGDIYARQIGNIVSIQGKLEMTKSGTVFNLPNQIDPPKHAVVFSYDYWACSIEAGQKACKVINSHDPKGVIPFSLTYMV